MEVLKKDQLIINPYIHGGRGVVVNTTGSDPVDRGFDPLRPPHLCARSSAG